MKKAMMLGAVLLCAQAASGAMVISEYMYQGGGADNVGEYIEFTNTGSAAVDMTGWNFDDASQTGVLTSLSSFGIVAPGQSVILTDEAADSFAAAWGLTDIRIIGGNTNNLGRSDGIYLYDNSGNLIDSLTYNDQAGQGPRTQLASCNVPAGDYGYATAQSSWVLATAGDAYGSWTSSRGEVGSPGQVPEPTTFGLFLCSGLLIARRRA